MCLDPGLRNLNIADAMISLRQLIQAIPGSEKIGITGEKRNIRGVTSDSRSVKSGFVFVALKGEITDGHSFISDAVARGCIAVVVENEEGVPENIPLIKVTDSHYAYGLIAAEYFGHPALDMKIVGLTGTNGKTTTSWIIEQVVKTGGGRPGVIGTVNYRYQKRSGEEVEYDASLTTPEPMLLQRLLREMKDAGVTHVILEASSHALAQKRLTGLCFDVAVFTNLSRDHLDYHESMDAYYKAKQTLFDDYMHSSAVAVVAQEPEENIKQGEKDWSRKLIGHLKGKGFEPYSVRSEKISYMTCGFSEDCIMSADNVEQDINGTSFDIVLKGKSLPIRSTLIGRHNVSNMLVASAVCHALGFDPDIIIKGLQGVRTIPGRLERVEPLVSTNDERGPSIFVDYAHTPDALENVLKTLRPLTQGKLFCVFGCGGERDRGKRPIMGAVAGKIADAVMVTSDNPRGENPAVILSEVEKGLDETGLSKIGLNDFFLLQRPGKRYATLENRRQAIHNVCARADKDDVVLIAGKGHETYQITATGNRFFDDRIEARNGSMRWTDNHLMTATAGKFLGSKKGRLLGRISTDTRTIKPGDVFVALKGECFDGHDYLKTAVKKGAAAVIVQKNIEGIDSSCSVILVGDTLKALGDLANYRRRLLGTDIRVVAITGSSGKTTVKEMTASIFEAEFERSPGRTVLKTKGNLNNLIGLPLSLLNINAGHRVAVLEMGMNRPGEIERLAQIAEPDIGCITNVQAAHLEGLGSIEGVAKAKGELFAEMSNRGIKIINYDDPYLRKAGGIHGNNTIAYAITPNGRRLNPDVRATRIISLGESGMRFTLHVKTWKERITVPATGIHNVANCAAATAIATAAGVAPEVIVKGLVRYRHGDKRMQIADLPGGIHVVNDSYNANPGSMAAALKTVKDFGKDCRRISLLGDMFELGQSAPEAHKKLGELVAGLGYDYLGVTGDYAEQVAGEAALAGMKSSRIKKCKNKEDMAEWVIDLMGKQKISKGDWILIKGSRGMRMEKVLHEIISKLSPDRN